MTFGNFTPEVFAFGLMSLLILGGAFGVIMNKNLVRGALWLIVSFFGVAGIFVLLSAPFLAAVQILVYIGAIGILITFAVMLTRSMTNITHRYNDQWLLGAVVAVVLFVFLTVAVIIPVWGDVTEANRDEVADTTDLGIALVSADRLSEDGETSLEGYVLPFEVASLLLTAAMIGAIVIAREED
jgi:NADH-quinone oxidoreductase subunit J